MVGPANVHFQDVLQNMAGIRNGRLSIILVLLWIVFTCLVEVLLLSPMSKIAPWTGNIPINHYKRTTSMSLFTLRMYIDFYAVTQTWLNNSERC